VPNPRIVSTEVFEDIPYAEAVYSVMFTERAAGHTFLMILIQLTNRANRDAYLR
jgi:chemotaxis protein CheY-P-specific phosphatase CheC